MSTDLIKVVENMEEWSNDRLLLISTLKAMAEQIEANTEEIEKLKAAR